MQTTSRTDGQDLMDTPSKTPRQPTTPARGTARSAQGKATGSAKGAKNTATQKAQGTKSNVKQQAPVQDDESEAATDDLSEAAETNGGVDEDADDAAEEGEQVVEGAAEGGDTEAGDEDEGDDIVPAGKVGDDGKSVLDNEGSIIGSVSGKGGKKLAGQVVDQEGDVGMSSILHAFFHHCS